MFDLEMALANTEFPVAANEVRRIVGRPALPQADREPETKWGLPGSSHHYVHQAETVTEFREPETPIEWALRYAERSHPVLPLYEMVAAVDGTLHCACGELDCENAGKHPRTAHGFLDATTDSEQIRRWWTQWPQANIGLRTGAGILVLDVDTDKGGDDSLEMLERKYGKLPTTRQALTGSGGQHRWFRLPDGVQIGCCSDFEAGLDIRADGGYAVVEPSIHPTGNVYRWDGLDGFDEPVADIPQWLLNILITRDSRHDGGEPWRQVEITVNRHPELPPGLVEFIKADTYLSALWNLRRADFADGKTGRPNFSRYDMALAHRLVDAGLKSQQVADVITAFRLKYGNPKGKGLRLDYLQRTVYRALNGEQDRAAEQDGVATALVTGMQPHAEGPVTEHTLEAAATADCGTGPATSEPTKPTSSEGQNLEAAASEPESTPTEGGHGAPGTKSCTSQSVEWLVAKVEATADFQLVYDHIDSLAAISEAARAIAYQRLKSVLGPKLNRTDFDRAIREAQARLAIENAKHAEVLPGAPRHPYRIKDGGIVRISQGKSGQMIIPLTNFVASIKSDIVEDDGVELKRSFGIEALLAGKQFGFVVPSAKFATMDWPTENIGPAAIVQPNQRDWARAAVQTLSTGIVERRIYTHTGWRRVGNSMLYLHGGGAIGANGAVAEIDVRLSGALMHYELLMPENRDQLVTAIRASLHTLTVAPDEITHPVLAAVYRAAVKSCDFGLWLAGPSGVFKSEVAALAQQHYGAAMNSRRLPGNFASTANSLEVLAFSTKDTLIVMDDFSPHGSMQDIARYHAVAERILRAAGNSQGRGRLTVDAKLREPKPPRGLILVTGEDVPRGQSIRGRTFILEVAPDDVNTTILTECQAAAADGLYARSMGAFVQWIAGQYDGVQARFQGRVLELRAKATRVHSRTPGIVADLYAGFELFLEFALSTGAITAAQQKDLGDCCWAALKAVAKAQQAQQQASEPAGRFLELVRAAILSGVAHVAGINGGAPDRERQWGWELVGSGDHQRLVGQGNRIGWLDGENLYLEPTAAFAMAQNIACSSGEPLAMGKTTINKRLNDKKLLATIDVVRGTLTVRRRILGETIPVLHLREDALFAHAIEAEGGVAADEPHAREVFSC